MPESEMGEGEGMSCSLPSVLQFSSGPACSFSL